jgi:hypothetical protein
MPEQYYTKRQVCEKSSHLLMNKLEKIFSQKTGKVPVFAVCQSINFIQ